MGGGPAPAPKLIRHWSVFGDVWVINKHVFWIAKRLISVRIIDIRQTNKSSALLSFILPPNAKLQRTHRQQQRRHKTHHSRPSLSNQYPESESLDWWRSEARRILLTRLRGLSGSTRQDPERPACSIPRHV